MLVANYSSFKSSTSLISETTAVGSLFILVCIKFSDIKIYSSGKHAIELVLT